MEIRDRMLYRKNLLWVPKGLVQQILESEHAMKVVGHMGQDKTIELVRRNFWWPKINERIMDFVRSCPECQHNKASRHQPYGLSLPLELVYTPWQSIAMDFITELPLSEGCDQLWVIVDRFTKMAHFIPFKEELRQTWPSFSLGKSGNTMGYPRISCQTKTRGLRQKYGRSSYDSPKFVPECPHPSTSKQTGKRNA